MRPFLLDELPGSALARSFDEPTRGRGERYAREGRVRDVELLGHHETQVHLAADVIGAGAVYEVYVMVSHDARGWSVRSECSCPVGVQCKHGVAVLATVREESAGPFEAPRPSWEDTLTGLLAGLEQPAGQTGLGLEVELVEPHAYHPALLGLGHGHHGSYDAVPGGAVLLRPLRQGARGRWVRAGATWRDAAAWSRHDARPDGTDPRAATALAVLAATRDTLVSQMRPSHGLELGSFGPGVWTALRRAVDAGVALSGVGVEVVRLGGPAQVGLDVVRWGDGHLLRPVVALDGQEGQWPPETVVMVGDPVHGVGLRCDAAGEADPGGQVLVLAPLTEPLDPGVRDLLAAPAPLEVPAEAGPALLGDYLPRVRRHVGVGSSDGSAELPPEQPPRLRLTLDWRRPGEVRVRWDRVQRIGAHEHVSAWDDPRGPRDPAWPADAPSPGEPAGVLRDEALLHLLTTTLPALRSLPEEVLEVVDVGDPVDYRELSGDPEIRFEQAGGPAQVDRDAPTDWLDLSVVVSVEGHDVALPRLLAALTLGEAYLDLGDGALLRTDHPALLRLAEAVRAAAELTDREPGEDGVVRAGAADLALWAELSELGAIDAQADRWVKAARGLVGFTGLPAVEPVGVVSTLRPYQLEGFRWMAFLTGAGLGGVLADDMGLGKTVQALAAISHARSAGDGATTGPVLVVAPTSVVGTWVQEAARHTPGLTVRSVTASQRRRGGTTISQEADGADVVVTSYTLLRLEVEQYAGLAWAGLVLDEAQQVKNRRSKGYQAVRCLDAGWRLALTGTPVENRLSELWTLLSVVAPGLYPDHQRFTQVVATPIEKRGDPEALGRLRRRVRPFLLRRTKDLVAADLPPKQEQVLEVTLPPAHRAVYDARLQRERQSTLGLLEDFDSNRVAIFAALTRLRQLCLDPGLVDDDLDHVGSAKLDELVERIGEVAAEGHRALVFSQFTRFLGRARERLEAAGLATVYLDGGTTDRQGTVREFREGDAPAFLISLKAGGVGLTLTEADYVFVLDPWWNPAVEAQAVDRAHRIGQTRPVMVYRMVATDTIEEKVMELKARKAALVGSLLDGDATTAQPMSAEDVRAMLRG